MEKMFINTRPVFKLDSQFKCRIGRFDKFTFFNSQVFNELMDAGHSRLAYADGADEFGFNQRDLDIDLFQPTRQIGRGHPTRSTTTDNQDSFYRRSGHQKLQLLLRYHCYKGMDVSL